MWRSEVRHHKRQKKRRLEVENCSLTLVLSALKMWLGTLLVVKQRGEGLVSKHQTRSKRSTGCGRSLRQKRCGRRLQCNARRSQCLRGLFWGQGSGCMYTPKGRLYVCSQNRTKEL